MLRKGSLVLHAVISSLLFKLWLFCRLSQSKDRMVISSYAQQSCEEHS